MRWLKLATGSLNQTPLDWDGNMRRARAAIDEARHQGAQFLCLPELSICGYGCEDAFHGMAHTERCVQAVLELGKHAPGMIVAVGSPVRLQHGVYNTVCILAGGRPVGIIAKQNLAGDGIHYEPRWFRAWTPGRVLDIEFGGIEVPFGDLVLDFSGVRLGSEICEDAWVPSRPGLKLALAGCDIIINPSASHFSFGKSAIRERIVQESSRAMGAVYVYSNLCGNEAGRVIYDGERLIAAGGEMIARGRRFPFREVNVTSAVIDVEQLRMKRARTTSFRQSDQGIHIVEVPWAWSDSPTPPDAPVGRPEGWAGGDFLKEEEFARAVALGLFDYLRKSRSGGFVVSLSGGADSAAVATLAALSFRMARQELGDGLLAQALAHTGFDREGFAGGLLDTVYQGSANSTATTRNGARRVAEAIGARHHEWEIDELVDQYKSRVERALGRELTWEQDDVSLQNIQARVRAPGVWMLANVRSALLLATSNRSEAAVGYATMDGDTCGSISPIAGIDKNYLRHWLAWMAETGPEGVGPISALTEIVRLPPTAELKPHSFKQTDEGDLMPYDLLDAIERLAVGDRLEPGEVFEMLRQKWSERCGGDSALAANIRKFFRLWCRNQWKRERYAPGFHLDDKSLDPKTWCRFPILSGGYAKEMEDLP